jgi:PilZ domain
MEHRWGHRREISRPVQLGIRGGVSARGRICNVSISGAFIVSPLPIAHFAYVHVQFTAMIDGQRKVTSVEAQVVRKDSTGFGVEWCEFAPAAVRALVMVPPFRSPEPAHPAWDSAEPKTNSGRAAISAAHPLRQR